MSFWEHLEELRFALWSSLLAFALSAVVALIFYKKIFLLLRFPLDTALEQIANENLTNSMNTALSSMHFMDPFTILIYIALLGGLTLASPVILYQLTAFIAPALSPREQLKIFPICAAATLLFLAGASFAFFWLAPLSIHCMYFFSEEMGLQVNWLASDYYSFIIILMLFVGLMFEFPLVIIALQYFEIISTKTLLTKWRWVILSILIACTLISPIGDPVALCLLTGILFGLYLISIFIGNFFLKRKIQAQKNDELKFEEEFKKTKTPPSTLPATSSVPVPSSKEPKPPSQKIIDDEGDLRYLED